MGQISFVNGAFVPHEDAKVSIEDRGFQFADGVYEVIALINGICADEDGHLDRLERSLSELRIDLPTSRDELKNTIRELIAKNQLENGLIYIQITRGTPPPGPRKFSFPDDTTPTIIMTARPFDFAVEEKHAKGGKAITVPDIRWKRRDIKSIALLPQVLAKQAAVEAGAVEALLVDDDGTINEGSSSNFWIVRDGGIIATRSTDQNKILKGMTRTAIFEIGDQQDIAIAEEKITLDDAYNASEAFITGSTSLVTPIVQIDDHVIGDGTPGPITKQLLELYLQYIECPDSQSLRWYA